MDEIINEDVTEVENTQNTNENETVVTESNEIRVENVQQTSNQPLYMQQQNEQQPHNQQPHNQQPYNQQPYMQQQNVQQPYQQQSYGQQPYMQQQNVQQPYQQQPYGQQPYMQQNVQQPYQQQPYGQQPYIQQQNVKPPYQQGNYGQAPYAQPGPMNNQVPPYYQTPGVAHEEHIGMAVGAIACSIASLVLCSLWFLAILLAAAGIVLGVICLRNQSDGKEMAIAAIITGSIGVLISLISCIVWMAAIFG